MAPPSERGPRDLTRALSALPLFPLQTVLFPGALLPLHVFEPRYRALVRDVLESHRALSVVYVTDPERLDEHRHPRIASLAGVGVIVDYAELPSGRFNILVRGRARVRLEEIPFAPPGEPPPFPYRRARATIVEPPASPVPASDLSALVSAATAFASRVRERDPEFEFPLPRDAPAGVVADLCAHHLVLDARERQSILETLDPTSRVRRVAEVLALQRLALSSGPSDMN